MKPLLSSLALLLLAASSPLLANSYYVDLPKGSDAAAGTREAPFKTIAKAIKAAGPGDSVVIGKVDHPIHETVTVHDKSGEPGRPIIIDGQGNLFTGCDPIKPADWTSVRPGVYRNDHLVPDLKPQTKASNDATIMRYFMVWKGEQNRMGRSSKGFLPPFVAPDQLKPGQWTYVEAELAFYIAIDPGKKLEDYQIEAPLRQNGVAVNGTCKHVIIRNFNTTHVINDGFNIHGHTEDVVFENIAATECGDDGVSAHEDCEIVVHGLVARRNSTGMCHGDPVTATSDHVVLEDNYAYNLLVRDGTYVFTDSVISAVAAPGGKGGIALVNQPKAGKPGTLSVKLVACKVPFPAAPNPAAGKPPFLVEAGVKLEVSPDCQIGGPITHAPAK